MNQQTADSGFESNRAKEMGRRALFRRAAALAGGAAACALTPPASAQRTRSAPVPLIVASGSKAVVETAAGKVKGYISRGIYTFKGIPYGAPVGKTSRFMAPQKPKPWAGVRSSLYYGQVSPQGPRSGWKNDEESFMFEWDDGQPGEDCLRVNVWTQGINDNKKRPVMVWLHGGGFAAGSGQELKAYEGESLARRGDVVMVSLNHRLNALGYLNLAAYGERYSDSGNAGMLDIVLALEWVRDNIANFGGDPGNVMIFGQSGGGAKVSTLMGMPSAKGLFHRAAVESGSGLRMVTAEASAKLAAGVLAELGLSGSQVQQLQNMDYARLWGAADAALRKLQPQGETGGIRKIDSGDRLGFGSVVDGRILPDHPFDPKASDIGAAVPMLIGCCLNETLNGINKPDVGAMTEQEVRRRVAQAYGAKADRIVDAYRQAHPKAKPFDILSFISAASHRYNAIRQAERKVAQGKAPAYLFWFWWQTPILDGRPGAFHCSELPFVFNNTDRCAAMTGGTEEARVLGGKVSDAWIHFARSGDPNHSGLPRWPVFNGEQGQVMIFDNKCEVKNDPDRAQRRVITEG